ncbi:MAG TPA: radical SAM protein [Candidatus Nanoarchaeia archaeon]|nr:radical SAM protein [Candidatus Nanoarchaeia archaeon]
MKISFVVNPCPALLDEERKPYGPIRTNTFPQAQVTLASTLDRGNYELEFLDARTLDDPLSWKEHFSEEYATPIKYGNIRLERRLIGNLKERIGNSSRDVEVYVLSANFTYEANSIKETIKSLKEHNPQAVVIVGGNDASPPKRHEFYFRAGADYIGLGDADRSLPEFLDDLKNGLAEQKYWDRLIPSAGRIQVINLSYLQDLVDFKKFSESGGGPILESVLRKGFAAYMEMQRGCNRRCDFCYASQTPFDRLNIEEIEHQIDNLLKSGAGLIMFTDDNTLLRSGAELERVFGYLREKSVSWEFPNGLEIGLLGSNNLGKWQPRKSLLDALFWNNGNRNDYSGAHRVLLPVEDSLLRESSLFKLRSGGQVQLLEELVDKRVPYINLGIMIGDSHETQNERNNLQRNLQRLVEVGQGSDSKINFSLFCTMPLEGTDFGRRMQAEGRVRYSIDEFPELWNVFVSVVDGDNFRAEEVTQYRNEVLAKQGMVQELGKVGRRETEDNLAGKVLSLIPKLRIGRKAVTAITAAAASVLLALGVGSYIKHDAQRIKQEHITGIPPFIFSGALDSPYDSDFFVKRALERANNDIEEKYGLTNFFDTSNS